MECVRWPTMRISIPTLTTSHTCCVFPPVTVLKLIQRGVRCAPHAKSPSVNLLWHAMHRHKNKVSTVKASRQPLCRSTWQDLSQDSMWQACCEVLLSPSCLAHMFAPPAQRAHYSCQVQRAFLDAYRHHVLGVCEDGRVHDSPRWARPLETAQWRWRATGLTSVLSLWRRTRLAMQADETKPKRNLGTATPQHCSRVLRCMILRPHQLSGNQGSKQGHTT